MAKIYKWSNITMSALTFLKYQYWFFGSCINEKLCDKIIEAGETEMSEMIKRGENTTATTYGYKEEKGDNDKKILDKTYEDLQKDGVNPNEVTVRKTNIAWLSGSSGHQWLFDLIVPYINEANKKTGWNFDISASESAQFTKYDSGGYYGWHADGNPETYKKYIEGISPKMKDPYGEERPVPPYVKDDIMVGKYRKISMTLNLTDPKEYDGGDLKFDFGPHWEGNRYHLCEEIRPRGSMIVFPSSLYHQVTPVTRGTRYSLVIWFLGKPFK